MHQTHLQQFVLLQSLSGHVQRKVIRVDLQTHVYVTRSVGTNRPAGGARLETLTTPLTKFRYLGIMSLKSSVMKTLLTNSCSRNQR